MRILIVSLLKRKITPEITASRPRIIYELTKGLIEKGHRVTVLGTGDSIIPGAKLIPIIPKGFVNLPITENPFYTETGYLVALAKKIEAIQTDFDIIHNHTYPEFINLLVSDQISTPFLTTVHAQATPELDETLSLFPKAHLIALSYAHKNQFKKTKIYEVVYNGVDTDFYIYNEKKEDYLLWLGRLSKAKKADGTFLDPKGILWAIQLAKSTGVKLLLSGNVEDERFFDQEVAPHLNEKIQWIGPVSKEQPLTKKEVRELMGRSKAYLMTVNWQEPFGLVMAEAMATGTPVIGFNRGAVPELVINGKTGFVVDPQKGLTGLQEALDKIRSINPQTCREHVVRNFSVKKMVENYEKIYKEI